MIQKTTYLMLSCMVIGFTSCDPPGPSTDPTGALWDGTYTVHLYGGGTEKQYDVVMNGKDDIFYSVEYDAFLILTEEGPSLLAEERDLVLAGEDLPALRFPIDQILFDLALPGRFDDA